MKLNLAILLATALAGPAGAATAVKVEGLVLPFQQVSVSCRIAGQIETIGVKEGESVTAGLGDAGAVLSEEWVVARAPEVVVLLIDPYDPADLVRHHPSWAGLPAVRAGRVHGLDPDLASRPGPRMADGVARLAAILHPERFEISP